MPRKRPGAGEIFTSDRVPREGSEARRRVNTAALALFSERGFTAVSVRDIMTACGLTSGALYAHYKSKEEVLFSLIREGHERLRVSLETLFKLEGNAAQRLTRLAYVHMLYQLKNLALARVAYYEYRYLPDDMRGEIKKIRRRMTDYFDAAIRDGMAEGLFEIQVPLVTRNCVLAHANFAPGWYDPLGEMSAERIAASHADMVLRIAMANGATALGVHAIVRSALRVMEGGWDTLLKSLEADRTQEHSSTVTPSPRP